jgi:GntR family transcriptional regulator, N-acetylglucosamine utilization regulator
MQIVDPNNPIPKYLQISAWLKEAIQIGRYPLGEQIPSEVELSRMCHVNRNTLRQAIAELTKSGLLLKKKGKGTFVTASEPSALKHQLNRISSFGQELSKAGVHETTHLIGKGVEKPTKHTAKALALGSNSQVIAIRRLRTGDEIPLIYEETYLPVDLFDGILKMDLTGSLYAIFTHSFDTVLARCEQTITALSLNGEIAQLLNLKKGAAALYMESVTYNDNNMPIEFLCGYFRGDKYAFAVELGQYHLTEQ